MSDEMVREHFVFEPEPDADVSIVYGKTNNGQAQLLLMRFHNVQTLPDQKTVDKMYYTFRRRAGTKGWEANRKGGSSGFTSWSKDLMKFLDKRGHFPRRSKAVILIDCGTKWVCYYMSPCDKLSKKELETWNRENPGWPMEYAAAEEWNEKHPDCPIDDTHPFFPTKWEYTPPVEGGSFEVKAEDAMEFPFLFEFSESKLQAAYLLRYLNDYVLRGTSISCNAATAERIHLVSATADYLQGDLRTQSKYFKKKFPQYADMTMKQHIMIGVMTRNKFTLVTHPVGSHDDSFSEDQFSLENKT